MNIIKQFFLTACSIADFATIMLFFIITMNKTDSILLAMFFTFILECIRTQITAYISKIDISDSIESIKDKMEENYYVYMPYELSLNLICCIIAYYL